MKTCSFFIFPQFMIKNNSQFMTALIPILMGDAKILPFYVDTKVVNLNMTLNRKLKS
jgi:hypothetical protein